jgi:peroxiredoxin
MVSEGKFPRSLSGTLVNLQLELYKFQREFWAKLPSEKAEIIRGATLSLAKDFQSRRLLRIDDEAPDFVLPNSLGQQISLSDHLKQGAVVLSFYFGGWCPFCNLELRAYQSLISKIRALGASILAISPQTIQASQLTSLNNGLSFDLLSDQGCQVACAYGIDFKLSDSLKVLYTELGHALPVFNRTNDWQLPVPATFIIDRHRHIALAHIDVDYSQRYEPDDAIAILLSLFLAA